MTTRTNRVVLPCGFSQPVFRRSSVGAFLCSRLLNTLLDIKLQLIMKGGLCYAQKIY